VKDDYQTETTVGPDEEVESARARESESEKERE